MKLSDFDFELPEDLIATRPARPRTSARLLVASPERIEDARVSEIGRWLRPGDRLVLNDTRVIPARLSGTRRRPLPDGGVAEARIEVTLLEPGADGLWHALIRPARKLKAGERIDFAGGLQAELRESFGEGQAALRFSAEGEAFDRALEEAGQMPLPPYIAARRKADEADREDYQTVFARTPGAVAAPTASLHFDDALLAELGGAGVAMSHVTLHVGAGTFLPVKVDDISEHRMHSERGEVTDRAAAEIAETRAAGGRIIPVGTTALRLIETAAAGGGIRPWQGATDIFITPGFRFRAADALMTNFHLPKSTLMMLVSALMGMNRVRQIYDHAIYERYRFFSYGDSSLLFPRGMG
ncbi:tRNA preQ1(34) S-adenosylmethionine ribosyltransferase-isomerase QueA [Roseicyclus sp. F158]|uniref:S-adenosylmethionine:tRNA ribosyltransferase-isomerase n=1 Tax=Tropicimonas omnivorans TaxID=3075590 RepID=A0ABU3DGS0_9RHOB|nr:tRNA preQ1(34) S-adenosylmethionine ribosyltransferase-isomerase QueA [Roseicyclus sp. F158]MDT0682899.1 tRNA preQ1(34) S-adenosylmethionine ribosyltransferase-isomerase QueA [Roseicyclus sp. F158]